MAVPVSENLDIQILQSQTLAKEEDVTQQLPNLWLHLIRYDRSKVGALLRGKYYKG